MLKPVARRSLTDEVYEQLRDQIVAGDRPPGTPLPAERVLCEALGVNRSSVREALRRLQQAGLISVRHGGTSEVQDYRRSAGLDLLADLIVGPAGDLDLAVIRSIFEVRSVLAPDIARLAAQRADDAAVAALEAVVARMRVAAGDLPQLQQLASELWSVLVEASDNVAYQLAHNSLRASYDQCRELFVRVLADEIGDVAGYEAIVRAVAGRDGRRAEGCARELMQRGERAVARAFAAAGGAS